MSNVNSQTGEGTSDSSVSYSRPTMSELEDELYIILANYSDDLGALKKREGKLPADYAVQAIQAYTDRAVLIEQIELVDNLIEQTRQTWHTKSPFTNIENINANTLASTTQALLTMKEVLKEALTISVRDGGETSSQRGKT